MPFIHTNEEPTIQVVKSKKEPHYIWNYRIIFPECYKCKNVDFAKDGLGNAGVEEDDVEEITISPTSHKVSIKFTGKLETVYEDEE